MTSKVQTEPLTGALKTLADTDARFLAKGLSPLTGCDVSYRPGHTYPPYPETGSKGDQLWFSHGDAFGA